MKLGAVAGGIAIRWNVFRNHRPGAHDGSRADPHELMNTDQPANDHKVLNHDVTPQRRSIGDDIAIADDTVVGNVTVHHQEILIAHARNHTAGRGSRVE